MINIVLYQPEKPANTGNIVRTCMCFDMKLHIIGPITFSFDDKYLKRAEMDYVKDCDISFYDSYEDFLSKNYKGQFVYLSRYGLDTFDHCKFDTEGDIYIMFGKESTGIPKEILKNHLDSTYRLPMKADARSLNLSNCVAICAFEACKQTGFERLSKVEVIKGVDWLLK